MRHSKNDQHKREQVMATGEAVAEEAIDSVDASFKGFMPRPEVFDEVPKARVTLQFDKDDESGMAYAHDPRTKDSYLLNQDTSGFRLGMFKASQKFIAEVTQSHFVAKIVRAA